MGLKIYSTASLSEAFSINGTFDNPFLVALDGKLGGILQKKLYVRNDDNLVYYTGITVQAIDTVDTTIVDGSQNITWKLSAGNTQPLDDEWADIISGDLISLSDIGSSGFPNTSTYLPFWVRVEIPRNLKVQTILSVQFKISTTEHAV